LLCRDRVPPATSPATRRISHISAMPSTIIFNYFYVVVQGFDFEELAT